MELRTAIEEFGAAIGVNGFQFEDQRTLTLHLGEEFNLDFELAEDGGRCFLYCVIESHIQPQETAELLLHCLARNYEFHRERPLVEYSFDLGANELLLTAVLDETSLKEVSSLDDFLKQFVITAQIARQVSREHLPEVSGASEEGGISPGFKV